MIIGPEPIISTDVMDRSFGIIYCLRNSPQKYYTVI
jgi:hypothetical protein